MILLDNLKIFFSKVQIYNSHHWDISAKIVFLPKVYFNKKGHWKFYYLQAFIYTWHFSCYFALNIIYVDYNK